MTQTSCRDMAEVLNVVFASAEGRAAVHELRARHASPPEYIDVLASLVGPGVAPLLRAEFAELPSSTLTTIVEAWAMADAGGKAFVIRSVRPERPIEFARRQRVRLAVEAEDGSVTVLISHVAGRHAPWYAPLAVGA